MNKYFVEIEFTFIRTDTENDENSPTLKELDEYMQNGYMDKKPDLEKETNYPRYLLYLQSLYEYGPYGSIPENINYLGDLKVSFFISELIGDFRIKGNKLIKIDGLFKTIDEVREDLEANKETLSDSIWEGMPGSEGIYPLKCSWNDETKIYEDELGLIGFNIIKIQKI